MVENPIRRGGLRTWWQGLRVKTWRLVGFPLLLLGVAGFVTWRPWTTGAGFPFQANSASATPQSEFVEITETPLAYQPFTENTPEPTVLLSPIPDQPTSTADPILGLHCHPSAFTHSFPHTSLDLLCHSDWGFGHGADGFDVDGAK